MRSCWMFMADKPKMKPKNGTDARGEEAAAPPGLWRRRVSGLKSRVFLPAE